MSLDSFITIPEIAGELGTSHNRAWRFCRSVLGKGTRIGNQRLNSRAVDGRAIAKYYQRKGS